MKRVLLRGDIFYPDGWSEGSILLENGNILDISGSTGNDLTADEVHEGLILPGLIDMHTHLGDHGARGYLPSSLRDTVLPGGVKHRFLSTASREEKVSSLRASIEEVHSGVTFILDNREGGSEGLDLLSEAVARGGPMICPLTRIEEGENASSLLQRSCGIGQPSLQPDLDNLRETARKHEKLFSIHASELFREDIEEIVELHPDQVIHMISGTPDDWSMMVDEDIPVTICPRSNLAYDLVPPLGEMIDSGLRISLGTEEAFA